MLQGIDICSGKIKVSIDNGKTWEPFGYQSDDTIDSVRYVMSTDNETGVDYDYTNYYNMSKEKQIQKAFNKLEGEECCNYCRYCGECNGLTLGPNGPIYPPCADPSENDYLDYKAFKRDYLEKFKEEINMNKVLELYTEREEKRIKDKYTKLREDKYNDIPVVKEYKELEEKTKQSYEELCNKYNNDTICCINRSGYNYESGYELDEEIMENIRESLVPDFNKEMEELHSKAKDIEALLSISGDKDYQLEVLKTYGLIDKKGIIVK